jgi:hypothetical protein
VTAPEVPEENGAWAGCCSVPLPELDEESDEPEAEDEPEDEEPGEVELTVDTVFCSAPATPITTATASPPAASREVTRRISLRPSSRLRAASCVSMVAIPSLSLASRLRGTPEKRLNGGLRTG